MPNALTAYTPTLWANESLALLREKVVMARLVRQDFSQELASAGDTVNTRKPAKMVANTVSTSTGITIQDVAATNIPVTLNNHRDASFRISDAEASRSFANLSQEFLDPAALAIANAIDLSLCGLYTDVTDIIDVGSAGGWKDAYSAARKRLNKNKVEETMRVAVLSDDDEGDVANLDILSKVNEAGDNQALREGRIGRFRGFDTFRSSNIVNAGSPTVRHNLFFHRDAFALVTRNLSPAAGEAFGVRQMNSADPDSGLSLRVTMSYNPTLLTTQFTIDTLYGVKTLDSLRACRLRASY